MWVSLVFHLIAITAASVLFLIAQQTAEPIWLRILMYLLATLLLLWGCGVISKLPQAASWMSSVSP